MQVTCMGGAAAWPNPGQGCSSYLVRDGSTTLLIDCGSNTLLELRKHIDLRDIDAIVISHPHSDHVLDLVPYRYALVYANWESPRIDSGPLPIWLPPGGEDRIRALGDALGAQGEKTDSFWEPEFELQEYDPDSELQIGTIGIRFKETQHFITCYAMRLSGMTGADVLYGADTGSYEPLVEFSQDVGLLIAEATMSDGWDVDPSEQGHIQPCEAGKWASAANVTSLLLTHLWHERPIDEVITQAAEEFAGPIAIARPGATFHV